MAQRTDPVIKKESEAARNKPTRPPESWQLLNEKPVKRNATVTPGNAAKSIADLMSRQSVKNLVNEANLKKQIRDKFMEVDTHDHHADYFISGATFFVFATISFALACSSKKPKCRAHESLMHT
eukprot:gnl/TRDRNA2_/TRDRNA2_39355_c1_seq1.p1 gnl/TRDRNA2_/TRDRNA2_39355_c1~~gnl/TRDRNA2_/TRDRNA2_39355_c1_seq1.p1  ORF type:complete len:124 (+),score=17.28 gnl/TRDRNA2_/TRDRNA2_39355_c1_seq1:2-373(+)